MNRLRAAALGILVISGLAIASAARADGRKYTGGHPYHNGFYFVPPSSAYEPLGLRPPFRYGMPAYYVPSSYMAPGNGFYPPSPYPGIPFYRSGGYNMSAYGAAYAFPW